MSRETMLDINWLKQNKIRGVVQAGMGGIADEIRAWNLADIKNQIYIEPHPRHFKSLSITAPGLACKDAKILCIQTQNETPCIWALVEPNSTVEKRTFEIFGTGHNIPENSNRKYVGTYQLKDGQLTFHCFELLEL